MTKELLLIAYPPLEVVAEQLTMFEGSTERYGDYTGQKPGTTITDKSVRNVDDVFEVVSIAPDIMERITSELGKVTIIGKTRDGEQAIVNIDPFAELTSVGTILIGE
ncbi:MAG TPA: hypothetical protein VMQ52_04545 [Candidatus Saccharimonadales bacterium]|jgi:hypothetical protein|nr:hypothetical protein [Candidatus Saccharimonadales bacterium]